MNFIANKKIFFGKKPARKKLKQSKLDGFLKSNSAGRGHNANRSAMLQEFFLGAVEPSSSENDRRNAAKLQEQSKDSSVSTVNNGTMESRVVIAITEGRSNARGEVGLAAIDINAPELIMCQLSDDMWYSGTIIKIQMLNPVEMLLPVTFFSSKLSKSKLLPILRSTFPNVQFKATPRKHFHDFEALEKIERISATNIDDVKIACQNKYYALASCNALLSYVGIAYCLNFADKSLRIIYESRYAAMTIDMETSKRLELVSPLSMTNDKKTCLFAFMDHCMTRIGKRSLRARILEPFADHQMIKQCHDAISELLEKENYQCTLRTILKRFYQVDRLMNLSLITSLDDTIRASETMISLTLMLKNCLTTIPMLADLLSTMESPMFVSIRAGLEDVRYKEVLDHIDRVLFTNEAQTGNTPLHTRRINAIKPNVSELLDLSRGFYSKLIEDISALAQELSIKCEMSFQITYAASKGYQLTLNKNKSNTVFPEELILMTRRGNKLIFTTEKLNDLNARLKCITNEIMVTSNSIISNMLRDIRQEIDVVYLLTGIITELDIIQSFASLSRNSNFTRPSFAQETRVVDAVHPFLEFGRLKTIPVPNQVIATPDHNLFVITGPNMGGKTVYIKMIAVLQVMAQVGCFVPATNGLFRIADKLFSRIGFEDNIDKGISSFGLEVEQMSYILNNITPNSLVILDELGRGTNPTEGQEWAWKMCEHLAGLRGFQSNGQLYIDDTTIPGRNSTIGENRKPLNAITSPFVYVTTHFLEMTKLAETFHNIVSLYLHVEETQFNGTVKLNYTHKVQMGVTDVKEYGLALARTVKFPSKVLPKAELILKRIKDRRVQILIGGSNGSITNRSSQEFTKEKLFYDLYATVATMCRKNLSISSSGGVSTELKALMESFRTKCSVDLVHTIQNSDLKTTFSESNLFRKSRGTIEEETISQDISFDTQPMTNDDFVPETPSSNVSQDSLATKSSFMSGVDILESTMEERETYSVHSYHSLIKRMKERSQPVNPPDFAKRTDFYAPVGRREKSPDMFENQNILQDNNDESLDIGTEALTAGGDNELILSQSLDTSSNSVNNKSFFGTTAEQNNSWKMWSQTPLDIKEEPFWENSVNIFEGCASQGPNQMEVFSLKTTPTDEELLEEKDFFDTTELAKSQFIDCDSPSKQAIPDPGLPELSQKRVAGDDESFSSQSSNSNYNFRLGLLELSKREKPQECNIRPNAMPTPEETKRDFLTKYGNAIANNYQRKPTNRGDQFSTRIHPIGGRNLKSKTDTHLFKKPHVKLIQCSQATTNQLNNTFSSIISSIPPPEPQYKNDHYYEWLGQYCRSRVKRLGIPNTSTRRQSNINSIRQSKTKLDIASVNRKWESFYTDCRDISGSDRSNSPLNKRVSFHINDYNEQ